MSAFFNQPSKHDEITCKTCGESIEYDEASREGWLEIRDEDTPEIRFYCPDCKGEADISGDGRLKTFQDACKRFLPQLERWADEYLAVADDFGPYLSHRGVEEGELGSLYELSTFDSATIMALCQVAELDLDGGEQDAENGTCVFCGAPLGRFGGNNPDPAYTADEEGRCCDACNCSIVLPARFYIAKLITERNGGELYCYRERLDG